MPFTQIRLGGQTNLDAESLPIKNVADPDDPQDVSTKAYVDLEVSDKVGSDGTVTQAIMLSQVNYDAIGTPDPTILYLIVG